MNGEDRPVIKKKLKKFYKKRFFLFIFVANSEEYYKDG